MPDNARTAEGAAAAIAALLTPEFARQWLRDGAKLLETDRRPPTPSFRQILLQRHFERQEGRCHYCGTAMDEDGPQGSRPTLDHRRPLSRGGANTENNTCAACMSCNVEKASLLEVEFMAVLAVRRQAVAE